MNPDMQKAQDLIAAVEAQRNNLSAQLAYAHAELTAARRRIAELEAANRAAEAASKPAAEEIAHEANPQTQSPRPNGHLGHFAASVPTE